jgi:archaeosine synthase alpha-subunit
MLEVLTRSGAARRLAWRRGDHVLKTPLIVAHTRETGTSTHAFLLTGPEPAPAQAAKQGAIRITGGFLETSPAASADDGVWGHVHVQTEHVVAGRLAMLSTPPRPPTLDEFAFPGQATQARDTPGTHEPAEGLVIMSDEIAVAPGLVGLAGDPAPLAAGLVRAREQAGPARLLMTPGFALVHHAALMVYAGVDLLDTLGVERATHAGWYLTSEGAWKAKELRAPLCGGPCCQDQAPNEMDYAALLQHNLSTFAEEHQRIIGHMENDSLRSLVETRARAHPGTAALLRHLDRHQDHYQAQWPLHNEGVLHASVIESLHRPDVARYRRRMREWYRPPSLADVLVLLPCSARKPYSRSQSHRVFRRVLGELGAASRLHEVILTSPLGTVPREMENTWPAAHYDVPVTGHWDREEAQMIRHQLSALLENSDYKHIISHLPLDTHNLIADLLPEETPHTAIGSPTSIPSRDRLRRAAQQATAGSPAPPWPHRRRSDAEAVLRWQTGPEAARVLIEATHDVSGRPPGMRLYAERGNKGPLATFVSSRGLFAFTLRAARLLYEAGAARTVEIDDFTPRGTLFAVGIQDADPHIVPGDEVVLVHDGEPRGVGRAVMTGKEMQALKRGAAVEVRHHG